MAISPFAFDGGTHHFFPGEPNSLFHLRHLARAICFDEGLKSDFRRRCRGLVRAVCEISDRVTSHLKRGQPVPPQTEQIAVPTGNELRRLQTSVRLDDVASLLRVTGATTRDFARLVARPSPGKLGSPPWADDRTSTSPLLATGGNTVVVLSPTNLATAAVRGLVGMAFDEGVQCRVADSYHFSVSNASEAALRALGFNCLGELRPRLTSHSRVSHSLWQFDSDKVAVVTVATDRLSCPRFGRWPTHEIEAEVRRAREAATSLVARAEPKVDAHVLSIVLLGAPSNHFTLGLEPQNTLAFRAADFETIADVERVEPDSLVLWKYYLGKTELRRSTHISAWTELDTYGYWREQGRRFWSEFGPLPTHIALHPGTGSEPLRRRAAENTNHHTVPSWDRHSVVEVLRFEGRVVRPRIVDSNWIRLAVHLGGGCVAWVSADISEHDPQLRRFCSEIVRMVAYWIGEFCSVVPQIRGACVSKVVQLDLCLVSPKEWQAVPTRTTSATWDLVKAAPGSFDLQVRAEFMLAYESGSNEGERAFACGLVEQLLESHTDAHSLVEAVADGVCPIGPKRMLHTFHSGRWEALSRATTAARGVQEWDTRRAQRLSARSMGAGGPSPPEEYVGSATSVRLNHAVQSQYAHLTKLLAVFDALRIARDLIQRNEALVASDAVRDFTMASQVACFPTRANELREEMARHAHAAVSTRFLIEHVAAEPPSGVRQPSVSEVDELVAHAWEIVSLGMASDAAKLRLSSPVLRVGVEGYTLESGSYATALEQMHRAHAAELVSLARLPQPSVLIDKPDLATRFDDAALDEFGVTITDFASFLGTAADLHHCAVIEKPEADFIDAMQQALGWKRPKVVHLLDLLSLGRRASFLNAPGIDNRDVYPWRFNRHYSVLRRPFVRVDGADGQPRVLYGAGLAYRSLENLVALCTSGRYRARSAKIKAVMSDTTQVSASHFVDCVAELLRARGWLVATNVRKLVDGRLTEGGHDYGDIDVLTAEPSSKRLVAIECKDFSIARTPHEIASRLAQLFTDENSTQTKHRKRVALLENRLTAALRTLDIPHETGWIVSGAILLSEQFRSPLVKASKLPVWTMSDLRAGEVP